MARLQVLLVDKMRIKVEQLQAEVQKGESLQDRLSTLQAEAERLPALRTRLYALQVRARVVCEGWRGGGGRSTCCTAQSGAAHPAHSAVRTASQGQGCVRGVLWWWGNARHRIAQGAGLPTLRTHLYRAAAQEWAHV